MASGWPRSTSSCAGGRPGRHAPVRHRGSSASRAAGGRQLLERARAQALGPIERDPRLELAEHALLAAALHEGVSSPRHTRSPHDTRDRRRARGRRLATPRGPARARRRNAFAKRCSRRWESSMALACSTCSRARARSASRRSRAAPRTRRSSSARPPRSRRSRATSSRSSWPIARACASRGRRMARSCSAG